MIHGILLVAATATPCEAAQTQLALDACWSDRARQAASELQATYARVTAEMQTLGIDPRPLVGVQAAWVAARDATCAFGACLTELERERTAELKSGWVGEPFW